MQKLDALGALDNVLVYATSELGNPNLHSSASVPTVLAGGANVPFRFGRRLKLTPDCAPPNDSCMAHDVEVRQRRQQPPAGGDRPGLRREGQHFRQGAGQRVHHRRAGRAQVGRPAASVCRSM